MLVFPNAKINIGLNIIEKRNDGFHNLETVFYPINLCDILEFVPSVNKTNFTNTGIQLNISDDQNLVMKAYHLLKRKYDLPKLNIHIHKVIPTGAGLGGGSADATFMLRALTKHFEIKINEEQLLEYAQELGSDCPFFIKNEAVFAEDTGNKFSEISLDLSDFYILLIKPDIHIPTKLAFSNIQPKKPEHSLKELIKLPVYKWKEFIRNDFEDSVFSVYPEIKYIKKSLFDSGALYAQMSGSGSAVFGIFENEPIIRKKNAGYFYSLQKPLSCS